MARNYIKWGEWNTLEKKTGVKSSQTSKNEDKRTAQRKKFIKCKKCGGDMTYIKGTNILICENLVEKKPKSNETKTGTNEKVICGNLNLVDNQYMNYVDYLFNN